MLQFNLMIYERPQETDWRHWKETGKVNTVYALTTNGGSVLSGAVVMLMMSK